MPFGNETVVDPTGGGDSFVAGLVDALRRGLSPAQAAQRASDTAASTVTRLGGRPNLREPADPGER